MKDKFIQWTNRETLIYKIIDNFLFRVQSFLHWIKKGHLIRMCLLSQLYSKNLHLGCGDTKIKGFINSDAISGNIHINILGKLPFKKHSLNLIYSSHLIEHIYKRDAKRHIKDCCRTLKQGGKLIIQTPDLRKLCLGMYGKKSVGIINSFEDFFKEEMTGSALINGCSHLLFGHRYLYDNEELSSLLKSIGFSKIEHITNNDTGIKEISDIKRDKYLDSYNMTMVGTK